MTTPRPQPAPRVTVEGLTATEILTVEGAGVPTGPDPACTTIGVPASARGPQTGSSSGSSAHAITAP